MRVGINAQLLNTQSTYRSAGVSNYSAHLLRHLGTLALRPETDLSLMAFINAQDFEAPGVDLIVNRMQLQRPQARILWEQSVLPGQLQRHDVDLVHGLVNVLPLTSATPGVVTVHDLSFVPRTGDFAPSETRLPVTALSSQREACPSRHRCQPPDCR